MSIQTILIDDDDLTLFLNTEFIKGNKFSEKIHSFVNGMEALKYIESEVDHIQEGLVFLDLNMPLFNGWDFLEALDKKEFKNKLMIVVLTSSVNTADREKSKQYERVIEFMEKPLSDEKLDILKKDSALSKYFKT